MQAAYLAARSLRVSLLVARRLGDGSRSPRIDALEILAKLLHFLQNAECQAPKGMCGRNAENTKTLASFSFCVLACAMISCFSASRRAISIRALLSCSFKALSPPLLPSAGASCLAARSCATSLRSCQQKSKIEPNP
jgi:hypothetical protein